MVNETAGGGSVEPQPQPSKSIDEIANEVIAGAWGHGEDRKNRLQEAGYNYNEVQNKVNEILGANIPKETIYVVKKGDTLSGIAAKFGTTYQAIAKKNGIKNPNRIFPRTETSNIIR